MIEKKRHLAKALTWRFIGSADTFVLGWLVTGSLKAGITISVLETVTKTVLYYLHERAWYRTKWGVKLKG
tara:strand:- start:146 stop:355 length:210 start_codon:yes stop_codon:yes gene_type:complete